MYQSINDHFGKIATLLNASDPKEDKMYKSAIKLFKFSKVNGITLVFLKASMALDLVKNSGSRLLVMHLIL